eukprot:3932849-Rhodomonas_salina.3
MEREHTQGPHAAVEFWAWNDRVHRKTSYSPPPPPLPPAHKRHTGHTAGEPAPLIPPCPRPHACAHPNSPRFPVARTRSWGVRLEEGAGRRRKEEREC